MKDELDRISLGEHFAEAFNAGSWDSVIYIEQKLKKMWERDLLNNRCEDTMEKYAIKALMLKGRLEGLESLWRERARLLDDLKAHEDKTKSVDQENRRDNGN